jgi:adenosyl cobinamide kinase/adenosyl cobinamide phosphate guanylyltransferase
MKLIAESRQTKICIHVTCKNGLKQDVLLSLLFNFTLVCAIRRVLKLFGTHQVLLYNDDLNTLGASIRTVKENTKTLVFVSNEIGLELNYKKTKCMVMSQDQQAVQNHNLYIYR